MYQYSVAGVWDQPHFEKIGAIQAGALEALALAYRRTGEARWRSAAHPARLPPRPHAAPGRRLLHQPGRRPPAPRTAARSPAPTTTREDDATRRALGIPRIDTAIYADINGRVISALCQLYAASPAPTAAPTAMPWPPPSRPASACSPQHRDPSGGFTPRRRRHRPLHLRDQAAVGRALLALHRVTGDERWLEHALELADFMRTHLEDREHGGFFAHTRDPDAVGVFAERRKPIEENGLAARFLLELHRQTRPPAHPLAPRRAPPSARCGPSPTRPSSPSRVRMLGQYALALAEATFTPVDVTVVGDRGDPRTVTLHRAALRLDDPRAVVSVSPPGLRYPDIGAPAVYLCTDSACSTPIRDAEKLPAAALKFLATVP
jgi:uncharacterized protein YyaL (SSP411 family)